ncbi:eukaryotic translation initiation factor 4b, partial [Lasius niger]
MVNYCILCKRSTRKAEDASVTFHLFPKDKHQRRKWLEAINMDQVYKSARICSNHFKSTDFQETIYGQRLIIKENAIPTFISRDEIEINTRNLENIAEEQSDTITECSIEYNAAKGNPNSLKRKSMEDEELDVPLKNIRSMKNININEILKKPDEAKIVLEIAMETIQDQQRKI